MANFGFDLGGVDADAGGSGNYEPIPDGEYQLMCEEAEQRQTKAGTGYYIRAKFRVLGPSSANRIIFMNFNTHNPSAKAEEIGRRQLAGWARACGQPNAGRAGSVAKARLTSPMKAPREARGSLMRATSTPAARRR